MEVMEAIVKLKAIKLKYGEDYGKTFRTLRRTMKLDQHEVTPSNNSVISQFEKHPDHNPSIDTIIGYARKLGAKELKVLFKRSGIPKIRVTRRDIGTALNSIRKHRDI